MPVSEASNKALPPRAADDEVSADGHAPGRGQEVDAKRETSMREGGRMVSSRLDADRSAKLDRIRGKLGLDSDAEALRALVDIGAEALDAPSLARVEARLTKAVAARRPVVHTVDEASVKELVSLMSSIDEHREQVRYLAKKSSDNVNQIATVANARKDVDATAVKAIRNVTRSIGELLDVVAGWSGDDAQLREVVLSLRSST